MHCTPGWMATFKHPINLEELKLPPCVSASAYTDEELNWCTTTLQYYVDGIDAVGQAAHGIPDSAVSRRRTGCLPAGGRGEAAAPATPLPAPADGASSGARCVGASASGAHCRGRERASRLRPPPATNATHTQNFASTSSQVLRKIGTRFSHSHPPRMMRRRTQSAARRALM